MAVFSIGVLGILAPFWEPVFGQNGAMEGEAFRFFSGSVAGPPFWLDTGGVPHRTDSKMARFWRVWTSILEVLGLHFAMFSSRLGSHMLCKVGHFWLFFFKAPTGNWRAGGGTRSAKNYFQKYPRKNLEHVQRLKHT